MCSRKDIVIYMNGEYLNAVLRSIIWLRDNFYVRNRIDPTHLMVNLKEVEEILSFFTEYKFEEKSREINIPDLYFNSFMLICGYLAGVIDRDRMKDAIILEEIYEKYSEDD